MSFLEEVASYLYEHYEDSLENFCLVFPNKRAGLFFSKHLAGKSQKPIWAPDFRSINELMLEKSGWQIADDLSLLFTLYGIYCKRTGEVISFEEFYSWGEVILSDFDDLDKYLVHAGDLYRNLSDLKQMDEMFDYLTREQKNLIASFWAQFQDDPKYKIKAKFSSVWPKLSLMYEDFHKNLSDNGCVYEGMAYRRCIQNLAEAGPETFPAEKYIFIGFNALNACEIELFKYLKGRNKALFFWDYDDYYIQNLWHEAGFFMRDNLKRFPMPSDFRARTQGLSEGKTIRIHAVPSETGQTRVMNGILSDPGNREKDPVQTAVILPDEQILLPVLQNLPDTIPEVNISMGYPLSSSPAGSLFEKLSLLQRKRVVRNAKIFFRHQELIDIFNHPYIKTITNFYPERLTEKIRLQNQIWLTRDEILGQTDPDSLEIMSVLVRECTDGFSYVGWLSEICSLCLDSPEEESSPESICHREYLYVLLTALKRFEQIFSTAGFAVNIEICWKILRKNLKGLRVPFKGEPLNGLQIMGILETRAIDFDRIIILSMNEGIFPRAAVMASFIPYSLRKGFGLTTYEHQDAMFAYYFYRLLQRASEVDLIYNSASNEEGQSEKSRYLSQLQYENIFQPLIENKYAFEINIPERIAPSYTHNENTRSRLLRFCTPPAEGGKSLSPSALKTYVQCAVRFWYQYIEGLKEQDQISEDVDALLFGNLLHKTVELLYNPWIGKNIDKEQLTNVCNDHEFVNHLVQQAFTEILSPENESKPFLITGRNLIIREILLKYILRLVQIDQFYAPFTLIATEHWVESAMEINSGKEQLFVNLGGKIDRMDEKDNKIRIIDYKTGSDNLKIGAIEDLFGETTNPAALQALVYSWLVSQSGVGKENILPALFIVRDSFKPSFETRFTFGKSESLESYQTVSETFENGLRSMLSDLFHQDTVFSPTEDRKTCKYCPYKILCHRE